MTTMSKWEIDDNKGYGPCYIVGPREVGSEVPNLIAQVIGDSAEAEDNARKMVAAPEMYELLNKIRAHVDSTCRECESKAIVPEIDALLDKIEGGGE